MVFGDFEAQDRRIAVTLTFNDVQAIVDKMWDGAGVPPRLSLVGSRQMLTHHATGKSVDFAMTRGELNMPESEFKERRIRPQLEILKRHVAQ